eukprot:TRINITY_DN1769_c0_g1_i3.p1 TRINITY_DN1769_c0_g1~~TRINITY_DN1769_c0_g1_i3.p1  ORF type:complete len:799 (+),score=78.09 TRINITY_DN1769_c0_g1_i3:309-2705(+)
MDFQKINIWQAFQIGKNSGVDIPTTKDCNVSVSTSPNGDIGTESGVFTITNCTGYVRATKDFQLIHVLYYNQPENHLLLEGEFIQNPSHYNPYYFYIRKLKGQQFKEHGGTLIPGELLEVYGGLINFDVAISPDKYWLLATLGTFEVGQTYQPSELFGTLKEVPTNSYVRLSGAPDKIVMDISPTPDFTTTGISTTSTTGTATTSTTGSVTTSTTSPATSSTTGIATASTTGSTTSTTGSTTTSTTGPATTSTTGIATTSTTGPATTSTTGGMATTSTTGPATTSTTGSATTSTTGPATTSTTGSTTGPSIHCYHGKNEHNECVCDEGWTGKHCNSPLCEGCINGDCVAPQNCTCFPGWTGPQCSLLELSPSEKTTVETIAIGSVLLPILAMIANYLCCCCLNGAKSNAMWLVKMLVTIQLWLIPCSINSALRETIKEVYTRLTSVILLQPKEFMLFGFDSLIIQVVGIAVVIILTSLIIRLYSIKGVVFCNKFIAISPAYRFKIILLCFLPVVNSSLLPLIYFSENIQFKWIYLISIFAFFNILLVLLYCTWCGTLLDQYKNHADEKKGCSGICNHRCVESTDDEPLCSGTIFSFVTFSEKCCCKTTNEHPGLEKNAKKPKIMRDYGSLFNDYGKDRGCLSHRFLFVKLFHYVVYTCIAFALMDHHWAFLVLAVEVLLYTVVICIVMPYRLYETFIQEVVSNVGLSIQLVLLAMLFMYPDFVLLLLSTLLPLPFGIISYIVIPVIASKLEEQKPERLLGTQEIVFYTEENSEDSLPNNHLEPIINKWLDGINRNTLN